MNKAMDMLDGGEVSDTTLTHEEQELRELLKRVMIEPLQPLAASLKLLETAPTRISEVGNELKISRAAVIDVATKLATLITKINHCGNRLEDFGTDIVGKADSLIASREQDRIALDALHKSATDRLETLAEGAGKSAANLAKMETALLFALETHASRISTQMARQIFVLKVMNLACFSGIIALSLILFFRHFAH